MQSTLAKEFIARKMTEYVEPIRKGRRRGEAVGLGGTKYAAALVMAVYAMNSKEVEHIIDTRRGLISKWRSEPLFSRQMEELCSEFILDVRRTLTGVVRSGAFADAQYFSGNVKNLIVAMCDEEAAKGDGDFLLRAWQLLRADIIKR
jgi:hypothetical protein